MNRVQWVDGAPRASTRLSAGPQVPFHNLLSQCPITANHLLVFFYDNVAATRPGFHCTPPLASPLALPAHVATEYSQVYTLPRPHLKSCNAAVTRNSSLTIINVCNRESCLIRNETFTPQG